MIYITGSYNGSTADSESAYPGSQPKADPPQAENLGSIIFYTYVLRSKKDNTRYIGSTVNKEKRLKLRGLKALGIFH
jgi:hypothetical protein